ncbi:DUF6660 family protein [Marinilabilia salmonicolor]|uniref:DUF6660 family protein n=1 Tax=Marinilabilia salmonicolor TaxID=989 RepID=UPI0011C08068|nr:DUF6660 family protein [Marinilabilia salmonicolor]
MKYLAVILSMYVMVLTAIPCNDVHAANTNSVSLELSEQSPNQTNDVDLCSPFCFCHCCQTLSFPSFFSISFINLVVITLDIKLKEPAISSPVASIWQPPKI